MRIQRSRWPRWLAVLAIVLAAWAFLAVIVVLEFIPDTPTTAGGWVLLLVVGPPVYLAFELVGDWLFSAKTGASISAARFSLARVAVAIAVTAVVLGPFLWWYVR
jgi:hypothetical protein